MRQVHECKEPNTSNLTIIKSPKSTLRRTLSTLRITLGWLLLVSIIGIPYVISELAYRKTLGTKTGEVITSYEVESCYKGRNCEYTDYSKVVWYDDWNVSTVYGKYNKGTILSVKNDYNLVESRSVGYFAAAVHAIIIILGIFTVIVLLIHVIFYLIMGKSLRKWSTEE